MSKAQQTKLRSEQLKLSLLGVLEVWLGGRKLGFRTRKEQALLVYLALEPGSHPRDKLIALLWPEADQSKGRANLRMVLARLGDDLREARSVLQVQRDSIGIQIQHLELDVQGLEAAFAQKNLPEADQEEQLTAAVQLFRGDLLEGFDLGDAPEFEDWLLMQRELVRGRLDTLLERLAVLQYHGGRLDSALETAQRRLRLEPLNEDAHRQVIELHLAGGNRSAALEAFNACAKILHSELGLEPDAQTQELLGRIYTSSAIKTLPQTAEPTRLVGREGEWAQMEAAWQAGQAIVLHGMPGVGKSRLMTEFAASQGQYLHWLGRPGDASIPYGTHARTFKPLCEALGVAGLPGWVRAELARIIPGLAEAPPPITNDSERLRFLEAKAEALERFFAKGHAALIYDDLQFVDSASLEAAWYVLNKFLPAGPGKPHPILAFRSEELSGPFLQILDQAVGSGLAVMIEVKPLETPAVGQMLEDLKLSGQLGPNLHRFTGGNPLFILETIRNLTERGGLETLTPERFENRRRIAGLARSPRVQAIIERRLQGLSKGAQELAQIAAVMGEYFSLELGAKLLSQTLRQTAKTAEELEATQVLRGTRFNHDLIFETVLENIPKSLLPILHTQVLEAFEGREIPGVVRLKHALAAESTLAITRYALAAAEAASKLYAHEEIFSLLNDAARLFERTGLLSQAGFILTTLGSAMTLTGRVTESLQTHLQALQLYQNLGDDNSLAQLHLQLSLLHRALGELQPSKHYAAMALAYYRQLGDQPHLARALWRLGEAHWWSREYEQAQTCFAEAYQLGQQLGDTEVQVWVLKNLGQTAYFLGDIQQAQQLLHSALELAATLNDKIALGWVHFDLARVQLVLGLYQEATRHNQAALEMFEQSAHKAGIRATRIELGQLAALSGRLSEAQAVFVQNHQAVLESHENDSLFDMLVGDAVLLNGQGHPQTAAQLLHYILGQPQKDNPFAHVRAKQILDQLELSPAQIARARVQAEEMNLEQIATLIKTI